MSRAHLAAAARFLCERATALLPAPRVIRDRDGGLPYLSRYYLLGERPRMPDGSSPFDAAGNVREDAIKGDGVGVYLHRIHRGDSDEALHNHPWLWAFSLILAGGYIEERRHGASVICAAILPFTVNMLAEHDFHRVELMDDECWSLFVAGPRSSHGWGFWDRRTAKFTRWQDHLPRTS